MRRLDDVNIEGKNRNDRHHAVRENVQRKECVRVVVEGPITTCKYQAGLPGCQGVPSNSFPPDVSNMTFRAERYVTMGVSGTEMKENYFCWVYPKLLVLLALRYTRRS